LARRNSSTRGAKRGHRPASDGKTETSISGTAEDESDGVVRLSWKENGYVIRGRRSIEFDGSYAATVSDMTMNGTWYRAGLRVADFTMTASAGTVSGPLTG